MATAPTSSELSPWVLGLSLTAVLVFAAGALAGLSGSVALFEAIAHGAEGPSTKHLVYAAAGMLGAFILTVFALLLQLT